MERAVYMERVRVRFMSITVSITVISYHFMSYICGARYIYITLDMERAISGARYVWSALYI